MTLKLSADRINSYLSHRYNIVVLDRVSSTNSLLKQMAAAGAPDGTVLLAGEQTCGRGRMGREFFSPAGSGIYMSLLLKDKFDVHNVLNVTAFAAVAVARAIERMTDADAKIKWVNDIYITDKKVCGILTESAFDIQNYGFKYAVLGIGINVVNPSGAFPDDILGKAGVIYDNAPNSDVLNALAAAVLDEISVVLSDLKSAQVIEEYKSRSWLDNKDVCVVRGEESFPAKAICVDDNLRLIVEKDNGERETLFSGEVSIRV